ncbi:MAG: TonB C-terminal domain-containing protein [Rhizomicrobium sp.]
MTAAFTPDEDNDGGGRFLRYAGPVAVLVVLVLAIAWFASQQAGVIRQASTISTILPVEQPPPPPPPPKPIEPPKPVPEQIVQPTNTPPPPAPAAPQNNAITENAPAQAGPADAFNIGAGSGGGMRGAGLAGFAETPASYGQYARGRIMAAVKGSDVLHDKDFIAVVRLWFNARGTIAKIEITRPTGVDTYDAEIAHVLDGLSGFTPPSPEVVAQMPIQFTIDERHL